MGYIVANGKMEDITDTENTNSMMAPAMKDPGIRALCMVKENSHGLKI